MDDAYSLIRCAGTLTTTPKEQGIFTKVGSRHFLSKKTSICGRYVERNALQGSLVERAELWKYGSLWRTLNGDDGSILSPWPISKPRTWRAMVNRPMNQRELNAIRRCVKKGCPYGSDRFVTQASSRLQLKHTLRERGRPKKVEAKQ